MLEDKYYWHIEGDVHYLICREDGKGDARIITGHAFSDAKYLLYVQRRLYTKGNDLERLKYLAIREAEKRKDNATKSTESPQS